MLDFDEDQPLAAGVVYPVRHAQPYVDGAAPVHRHIDPVQGEGIVTLDGVDVPVHRGSTIDVGLGVAHRMHNTGSKPLVFVEVQHGDYFGEDDIIRLEDDYGRSG